ncbi:DUF397 domain-containing protein [Streptomyces sp. NPDC090442]|uniref:DUF397 domain-containing protein n=1 Tax=Streptomyces sp. NPDC090442 TaxID=3365962 RepID=UPI00382BCAB1
MSAARPTAAELAAARFVKSSYSGGGGNECVECASVDGWTAVRDSKSPGGPVLVVQRAAFDDLLKLVTTS